MATIYGNVESKLENAGAALAQAALTLAGGFANVQVNPGKAATDETLSVVEVSAGDAVEDPPYSGNYLVPCSVIIKSSAAIDADGVDPTPADDLLIGTVFNAFLSDDLPAQLSAAIPDFACQGAFEFHQSSGQNGDAWENELKFTAYCCPSAIAA